MLRWRTSSKPWRSQPEIATGKHLLVTRAKNKIARVTFPVQQQAVCNSAAAAITPVVGLLKRFGLFLTISIFLAAQSGCMTAGEQLDQSAVSKLQKGQTLTEVRNVFGSPKRTETGADGKRLDFYQVTFARKIPGPNRALVIRSLCVLYDANALVEDFVRHVGELPIRQTAMGWEAGEPLDQARIRGIQREAHSRNDMVFTFGSPTVEGLDRHGDAMLAWYYIRGSRGFFENGYELLAIFDSSNRVKDYLVREIRP